MVVIGASENPDRYSCKTVKSLVRNEYAVVALGPRAGFINETEILTGQPGIENVDTILLYVGHKKQEEYYDYILSLNPKRVIFNPGTENPEFQERLKESGIEVVRECALIMINTGTF